MKRKDQDIDKLLRNLSVEKAPANFTDAIMKDISILTNEELLKDAKLSAVLKDKAIEQPSISFVSNVMSDIESNTEKVYQPLISKKSWFIIGLISAIVVMYISYNATPTTSPSILDKTTPYVDRLQALFSNFKVSLNLSMIFVVSLLSISSLIFIDFFSKGRISL